jgi:hypothetical protein
MFPYGLLEAAKALTTDHESPEIGTWRLPKTGYRYSVLGACVGVQTLKTTHPSPHYTHLQPTTHYKDYNHKVFW